MVMKTRLRSSRPGFTLIELLTVMTIILLLAGLVIGGMMLAKEKQRQDKAKVQVHLLSNALEQYKADNGSYPPSTSSTGENESNLLYKALYYDGEQDSTKKIYLADLNPEGNKQGWIEGKGASAKIVDPWKNEYLYRSGAAANNPDFDLWSKGKDGKTVADDAKAKDSLDDQRN
jgi:general secretion pathway protein G